MQLCMINKNGEGTILFCSCGLVVEELWDPSGKMGVVAEDGSWWGKKE